MHVVVLPEKEFVHPALRFAPLPHSIVLSGKAEDLIFLC